MFKLKKLDILWSKNLFLSIFFLFILHFIGASSNIWLSKMSTIVATGSTDLFVYYFCLFSASLFLINLPETVSNYYLNLSKLDSIKKYTKKFAKSYGNIPASTFDSEFREQKEPWLAGEAISTLNETNDMIHASVSLSLSLTLNASTLAMMIDPTLMYGYLFSFVSTPILYKYLQRSITNVSLESQRDRKSLRQILLLGWENITVGNVYNFKIWGTEFIKNLDILKKSSGKQTLLINSSNSISMIVIMLPVIFHIAWLAKKRINDPAFLMLLVGTLNKQLNVLNHINLLFNNIMQWKTTHYPRFNALFESVDEQSSVNPLFRINLAQINFSIDGQSHSFDDIKEVMELLFSVNNGRFTIIGNNGVGKSTLLCYLKECAGEKAFYLPANSRLMFKNTFKVNSSSGEKTIAQLDEMFSEALNFKKPIIILLDEWDANLDDTSIIKISTKIEELSKNCVVLEVRHRNRPVSEPSLSVSNLVSSKPLLFSRGNNNQSFLKTNAMLQEHFNDKIIDQVFLAEDEVSSTKRQNVYKMV